MAVCWSGRKNTRFGGFLPRLRVLHRKTEDVRLWKRVCGIYFVAEQGGGGYCKVVKLVATKAVLKD